MIPDGAVEAAAKALWELDIEPGQKQYEDCREGTKRNLRREATAMLEAAAPYMLAEAAPELPKHQCEPWQIQVNGSGTFRYCAACGEPQP